MLQRRKKTHEKSIKTMQNPNWAAPGAAPAYEPQDEQVALGGTKKDRVRGLRVSPMCQ